MPQDKTISFRSQLSGDLGDFLADEGMPCVQTGAALVELVVALSTYQEEGVPLFPRVLVCDDLESLCSLLQAGEHLEVGTGPRGAATIKQALKRCAPLARHGWSLYVHRVDTAFRFGVLREPSSPVALDLRDSISDLGGKLPVLCVSQVGDKAVEVVGGRGLKLVIYVSAARTDQRPPREAVEALARTASVSSNESVRESLESYLRTTLSTSLQRGHGALIAVLNADNKLPEDWVDDRNKVDGVILSTPIDLADAIADYQRTSAAESLARLLSYSNLLDGMLSADGITILGPDGKVRGYNLFVRTSAQENAAPSTMIGGARRRAFGVLQSLVDQHHLSAALFRSADGGAQFHGDSSS